MRDFYGNSITQQQIERACKADKCLIVWRGNVPLGLVVDGQIPVLPGAWVSGPQVWQAVEVAEGRAKGMANYRPHNPKYTRDESLAGVAWNESNEDSRL